MELAGQCYVAYAASVVVLEALMDKGSTSSNVMRKV